MLRTFATLSSACRQSLRNTVNQRTVASPTAFQRTMCSSSADRNIPSEETELQVEHDTKQQKFYILLGKGLRVRLKPSSPKRVTKTNVERCREYRAALKADPDRYAEECLRNQARNRRNRQRPLTVEEKTRRRELNKLRQQECRAKKRAAQLELARQTPAAPKLLPARNPCSTRSKTKGEEDALQMQRQKWAEAKREQRKRWTSQKRRRVREKALQRYYEKKAQSSDEAVLEYEVNSKGEANLLHTGVPEAYRGHGLAKLLAVAALDHFAAQGTPMHLQCSYLQRHAKLFPDPEHQKVILPH